MYTSSFREKNDISRNVRIIKDKTDNDIKNNKFFFEKAKKNLIKISTNIYNYKKNKVTSFLLEENNTFNIHRNSSGKLESQEMYFDN